MEATVSAIHADSGTLTDISDISVRNVTDGIDYAQQSEPKLPSDVSSDKEWNSDYANHWYIADVSDGSDHPKAYTPGTDGSSQRLRHRR